MRQLSPISTLIFNRVLEFLAREIRHEKEISSFKMVTRGK
jgi:hypothetical protein